MAKEGAAEAKEKEPHESGEPEESRDRNSVSPEACVFFFLDRLDSQIRCLRRLRKEHAAVAANRTRLELLTCQIPDSPASERLLRYEAALERSFDRTLGQLERLQRMRLGLPASQLNVAVQPSIAGCKSLGFLRLLKAPWRKLPGDVRLHDGDCEP
jgi:hypothetical protein